MYTVLRGIISLNQHIKDEVDWERHGVDCIPTAVSSPTHLDEVLEFIGILQMAIRESVDCCCHSHAVYKALAKTTCEYTTHGMVWSCPYMYIGVLNRSGALEINQTSLRCKRGMLTCLVGGFSGKFMTMRSPHRVTDRSPLFVSNTTVGFTLSTRDKPNKKEMSGQFT